MRDKIEHAIQNQPCTVKELKQKFGGERGADRKVMEALDELVREAVVCQRQGVFFTVRSGRADKALLCKVVKLGKNFAFVMLEDGTSDIFIPGRFTKGAMPGDEVLVEKFEHPRMEGSDEGTILAVLTEKNDLVGTVRRVEGRLRFVPDDCPAITMPLARDCEGGAKDGDKVAVEILNRGNRQEDHRVGVAMRFGSSDEAKRCAKALLYAKDIRTRFPDKVREEAKKFEGAEISEKDCEGRMDLRALPIFTIDSAETKDIDDAVSLTRTSDGGFELGVHIADVSNYVKPGTELDNEAFSRATSVYYADQVVPMLPKALSNGICSLNENELRLAFSCLMRLDKDGNLTDYRFVKSIIRSRVKGVYAEINALLAGTADAEIKAKYADVIDQLPAIVLCCAAWVYGGMEGLPLTALAVSVAALLSLALLYRFIYLRRTRYHIGSEQLISRHGVLSRKTDYMEQYRIVDFVEHQSLMQQLCGLKTVRIFSMDRNTPRLDLVGIRHNFDVVTLIRERVEYNKRKKGIYEITNH